jgi:hypothetical protein
MNLWDIDLQQGKKAILFRYLKRIHMDQCSKWHFTMERLCQRIFTVMINYLLYWRTVSDTMYRWKFVESGKITDLKWKSNGTKTLLVRLWPMAEKCIQYLSMKTTFSLLSIFFSLVFFGRGPPNRTVANHPTINKQLCKKRAFWHNYCFWKHKNLHLHAHFQVYWTFILRKTTKMYNFSI